MRRRPFVAAAVAGLFGGCVEAPSTSSPTTPSDETPRESTTPPGGTTAPPSSTASDEEYLVSGFDVSTTKTAPTERYYLRITHVYSSEAVEREDGDPTVRDASEIDDPDLRAAVESILSEGKLWREEIPDGLRELVERVDFFTWEADTDPEDTASHWRIAVYRAHPERDPVVEFDADLVDDRVAPGDPGAIVFSLTNTGDRTQSVFSGTVPPFSVLWAERSDGEDDDRALLWREYSEEGCVSFEEYDGEPAVVACSIGVGTDIEPGETIERQYELRSTFDRDVLSAVRFDEPGEYAVTGAVQYHRTGEGQGPSTAVEWEVAFEFERA